MRRTTMALLAATLLALAGCSSGGEPDEKPTATITATPSLSKEEARAACIGAWRTWFDNTPADYNPDTDPLPTLPPCDGLPGQAEMATEALVERNRENRERHDACTDNPADCTESPTP